MVGYFLPLVLSCLSLTRCVFGDDDHGANVVSYDSETFADGLKGNRNFVMFYAPWCGHCKNLAPTWSELASFYNTADGSPVVIAKVDCTVHTGLCADHEIVGFPTLKMFDRGGANHKRYTGKRDLESLRTFIEEHLNREDIQAFDSSKQQTAPEPQTGPIVLTDENFTAHVEKGLFFIKFYAPWCGHCQRLAPTWDDLAKAFSQDNKVNIAKIDCTQSSVVCKDNGIGGYPTLLWFTDGVKTDQYQGQRSLDDLKRYVSERSQSDTNELPGLAEQKALKTGKDSDSEEDIKADVKQPQVPEPKTSVVLTAETFKERVQKGSFFVKFYAHWSAHCRHLAPTWDGLANIFNHHSRVTIAKIDCGHYMAICDEYQVNGHPTLLWLIDGVKVDKYQGERTHEELKKYISDRLLAEPRELPRLDEEAQEPSQNSGSEVAVKDLTDETFKPHISTGLHFVKFFAPWCGHCKRLAPTWDDLGRKFQQQLVSIAKVDCTQHKATCEENQVRGYPTLKLFRDGEFVKDYKGTRTLEDLYEFVRQHVLGDHDEL